MSEDYKLTLENDNFKDVKFLIGKKEIWAHKIILAARNPVFKKMFVAGMKESQSNEAVITDVNFDTFEEMIHFIYTGKVSPKFSELAMELFEASHKYQIENLKKLCEMEISQNLSEENSAAVMEFANFYDCDDSLKEEAAKLYKR